jgi:hypothetical protein
LKELADTIENTRIKIYSGHIDLEDDKQEVDDKLFSIQSKLRDVAETIKYYEEMEIKYKCNCGKQGNINNLSDNFEYAGCDEENNPIFMCKDCNVFVWG